MIRNCLRALITPVFLLSFLNILEAASYDFTTIDVPGASSTVAQGINDRGQIVGGYSDEIFGPSHLFVTDGDQFVTIDIAGSSNTTAFGINNQGKIVGSYVTSEQHGFLYPATDPVFTPIDVPFPTGVFATRPNDINNRGQIVGEYLDQPASNEQHGFVYNKGHFRSIDVPDAEVTSANGINDNGAIVGFYADRFTFEIHGFIKKRGAFSTIDVPFSGASNTSANGINNKGQIVGIYQDGSGVHGYLCDDEIFTSIDVPGAFVTLALGINQHGSIVGWYSDALGIHGFVATPKKDPVPLLASNS
jgi:probable HAF family extracellular repeat protein